MRLHRKGLHFPFQILRFCKKLFFSQFILPEIEPQRETKTQQAKDLICTLLAGGKQVLSEDIDKAALERGIPGRTVRDAKRELGDALKSKIGEGRKKVFWME